MSVYLNLFHGRKNPDVDMEDWGFRGPTIGPLDFVHITYMSDIKVACSYEVAVEFFPEDAARHLKYAELNHQSTDAQRVDAFLKIKEDLVQYRGEFFGDFTITSEIGA